MEKYSPTTLEDFAEVARENIALKVENERLKKESEEKESKKTLLDRIEEALEVYKCKFHSYPSFENPHGCTDCYNRGYILDSLEANLLAEAYQALANVRHAVNV